MTSSFNAETHADSPPFFLQLGIALEAHSSSRAHEVYGVSALMFDALSLNASACLVHASRKDALRRAIDQIKQEQDYNSGIALLDLLEAELRERAASSARDPLAAFQLADEERDYDYDKRLHFSEYNVGSGVFFTLVAASMQTSNPVQPSHALAGLAAIEEALLDFGQRLGIRLPCLFTRRFGICAPSDEEPDPPLFDDLCRQSWLRNQELEALEDVCRPAETCPRGPRL